MAKVRIKATAEEIAKGGQDRGDFILPKPGFYILTMTECNPGFSKGDDGEEDKKKPRLECVYKITGVGREEAEPKENYGNLWDYVSFSSSSGWKRGEFLKAYNLIDDPTQDADVEIDTDDVINRKVLARIKHEKGRSKTDPPRAKIATLFPYGSDHGLIEDESDAYSEASDAEDAFGSTDIADADEPKYTQADLEAMDLKGVGVVYTELTELDPRDLMVKDSKGKLNAAATKTAVIEEILKVQGSDAAAEEDAFGDDADEDPF